MVPKVETSSVMSVRLSARVACSTEAGRPNLKVIGKTFKLGLPASVEQATRALSLTLMTLLVSTFGTIAVDAYGLGLRILTFVVIPAMGLAMATTTLVAQN